MALFLIFSFSLFFLGPYDAFALGFDHVRKYARQFAALSPAQQDRLDLPHDQVNVNGHNALVCVTFLLLLLSFLMTKARSAVCFQSPLLLESKQMQSRRFQI